MQDEQKRLIYTNISSIVPIPTSHTSGLKQILCKGFNEKMQVKQIAVGILQKGEVIPPHSHPDMDECYYVLEGEGTFHIDGTTYPATTGAFFNIPARSFHSIECSSSLRFLYSCLMLIP